MKTSSEKEKTAMRMEFYNTKEYKLDLHMVTCGYEDSPPNFVCAPHFRSFHLIHYVAKGAGFYEVNGERYKVKKGDVFLIYPNELVTYYCPDEKNPWSLYWLGFSGRAAERFFDAAGLSGYVKTVKNTGFGTVIANCLAYVQENQENLSMLRMSAFVLEALHSLSGEPKGRRLNPAERVEQALRYIEFNYMNAISPKDVADHLSIERSYFYRIFKKYAGTSPEQYILRYRMQKAAELIRLRRYSISEIAGFVGTKDIFYFSRLFKKVMGVSPTDYADGVNGPPSDADPKENDPKEDDPDEFQKETVILI